MNPISIRISADLDARIERAAKKSGFSKNDIIKLTIDAGLKWLAANDYTLTGNANPQPLIDAILAAIDQHLSTGTNYRGRYPGTSPPDPRLNEPPADPQPPPSKPRST
jgi:Ribbon-helix-helix protein, copG family